MTKLHFKAFFYGLFCFAELRECQRRIASRRIARARRVHIEMSRPRLSDREQQRLDMENIAGDFRTAVRKVMNVQ